VYVEMQAVQLPRLPSDYAGTSLLSYSNQWKEHQRRSSNSSSTSSSTVFGLAFFSETTNIAHNSTDVNHWLFGCTADGEVCVWKLCGAMRTEMDDEDEVETAFPSRQPIDPSTSSERPVLRLKVSRGVLYSCKMVERPNAHWLVVSGDDGEYLRD
jgi:hypothetical protein